MTLEEIVIAGHRETHARLTAGEPLRCACCGKKGGVTGTETPCVSCGFTPAQSGMIPAPSASLGYTTDPVAEVFTAGRGSP